MTDDAAKLVPHPSETRRFRRAMRTLFELGESQVDLMGRRGEVRVVVSFGKHRFVAGSFVGADIGEVVKVAAGAMGGQALPVQPQLPEESAPDEASA